MRLPLLMRVLTCMHWPYVHHRDLSLVNYEQLLSMVGASSMELLKIDIETFGAAHGMRGRWSLSGCGAQPVPQAGRQKGGGQPSQSKPASILLYPPPVSSAYNDHHSWLSAASVHYITCLCATHSGGC